MRNYRIVEIYHKLINDGEVSVKDFADENGVSVRTVQRDINDLKTFLLDNNSEYEIIYLKEKKAYKLSKIPNSRLTKGQVLAISKIILDSRAFCKKDIKHILENFIKFCSPETDVAIISELVKNEIFHYLELQHHKNVNKTDVFNDIWTLGKAIKDRKQIKISYKRESKVVERIVDPVGLMFSEYYFYLLANITDEDVKETFNIKNDPYPTIYRVDRIKKIEVTNKKVRIDYKDRFQEGEFRKRIHFMTGGELRKVKFWYKGKNLEAVLDKIPTAKIEKEATNSNGKEYLISAEVFGNGIDRYLRSLGEEIENIRKEF